MVVFYYFFLRLTLQNNFYLIKINKKGKQNYQAIATDYNNACLCNFMFFGVDSLK